MMSANPKSPYLLLFLLGTLLLCFGQLQAQTEEGNPALNQEVITFGNRQIKLRDAYRISSQPELFDTSITKSNVEYQVKNVSEKTRYTVQPIQAANLRIVEPLNKLQRLYVKSGVGMYTSPIGELYFNSLRSRNGAFGLALQHHSSAGGIKPNISNGAFSDNNAQLWGKTFVGKHSLFGEAQYKRSLLHRYGYNFQRLNEWPLAVSKTDLQEIYQEIGGRFQIQSYYDSQKKLNHKESLAYYRLTNKALTTEQNFSGDIELSKYINKERVQVLASVNNNDLSYSDSARTRSNNTIIGFAPSVSTKGDKLALKMGLALFSQIDTNSQFHFFPDVEVSYQLIPAVFMPYAGISGGVQRASLKTTVNQNPFVNENPGLTNQVDKYRIYLGAKTNLSSSLSFHFLGEQKLSDQVQLFVNDTSQLQNRFMAIYDRMASTRLMAEFDLHKAGKWQINLRGEYFIYDLGKETKYYNMPQTRIKLGAKYNLAEKFYLNLDAIHESGRFARIDTPNSSSEKNLGDIFDLNLGLEYRYTKKLSAFVQANNLANQKYLRFNQYQVQGITIFGGFTFAL